MLKEMIRGAGNTCIFFHNAYLSQYVLEGKHPSSRCISDAYYKKFSFMKTQKVACENARVQLGDEDCNQSDKNFKLEGD